MTSRNEVLACLLVSFTCSCGSSANGSDASPDNGGSGMSGQAADAAGGSSANMGSGGSNGGSTTGSGGTQTGAGGSSGAGAGSSGGSSSGGSSSGGSSSGGSSTGGSTTGGDAGAPGCAEWATDAWRSLPTTNAPSAREEPWLIPTGDGLIVFGGYNHAGNVNDPFLDDGAIYHLCDDTWTPMSTAGVPHGLTDTVAQRPLGLWTGSDLLVWGGYRGTTDAEEGAPVTFATRYSASGDAWSDMNRHGEPTARDYTVRLWTGEKLLVWGGIAQSGEKSWVNHDDGALYDPKADRWTPMSTSGAPAGRFATDRAVWTGQKLIVWGGLSYATGMNYDPAVTLLDDGGVYDLATDSWTPIASEGAPHGGLAPFTWTGRELIVISELDGYSMPGEILFEGARFDPARNAWSKMSAPSLALADTLEFANLEVFWLGDVVAVIGEKVSLGTGGPTLLLYEPASDSWSSGPKPPSTPSFFSWQSAIVAGDKLVVVGPGAGSADARGAHHASTTVAIFDAKARAWSSLPDALDRSHPGLVALPEHLVAWGGKDVYTDLDAPNPCAGATGPCDPITPTIQTLLGDGVGISY